MIMDVKISKIQLRQFILRDIQFNLKKGECLALIGENGAGKTTLLKTLAGVHPFEGSIKNKEGLNWNLDKIEYIPPYLSSKLPLKTLYFLENSFEKLCINSLDHEKIKSVSKILKIDNLLQKNLNNLSSGETVKILLARMLLRKKPIILWDEPSSFLDLKSKIYVKRIISKIKKNHIFIISSHDYKWIRSLADGYLGIKNHKQAFVSNNLTKNQLKKILI